MVDIERDLEMGGEPSLVDERPFPTSTPQQFRDCGDSYGLSDVYFRAVEPQDREQVQALHERWFPVKYEKAFYDALIHNKMAYSGEPLYTCVAVRKRYSHGYGDAAENHHEEIIACVVGSFVPTSKLSHRMQSLLVSDRQRFSRLFYIMTLGTVTKYRGAGLGSIMVQKCVEQVERELRCGVLYLHVITYNKAAIRLYEKLGFHRVEEIPKYYTIDNEYHSCYLYAKYYHGTFRKDMYYHSENCYQTKHSTHYSPLSHRYRQPNTSTHPLSFQNPNFRVSLP